MHLRGYPVESSRSYKPTDYGTYGSPKNSMSRARDLFLSPNLQEKYPASQKYNSPTPAPRPLLSPQHSSSYHNQSGTIQSAQLRLTISQLRNSLQVTNQNSQRLQEQLFAQRKKTYQLSQMKRRLQETIEKMQFQFERIGNYESLEGRQASIKLQTALRENSRLSHQVSDLIDENKTLKQEQRKLMSEVDKLIQQRSTLTSENEQLLSRLRGLERQVREVRRQFQSQSNILQATTHRSYRVPTVIPTVVSIPQESVQEVDYGRESQKLLGDYQKLLVENQSMKRLYNQFYKDGKNRESIFRQQEKPRQGYNIPEAKIQDEVSSRSFSNHHVAEALNSERSATQENKAPMFKTFQKNQLKIELENFRTEAVTDVQKVYTKSLKQAEEQKKNALKIFMEEMTKNASVFGRMSQNYLQLRATVREQAGVELPLPPEGLSGEGALVLQMYRSVKDKAKGEGGSGLIVAVFRLLTLLSRCQSLPKLLVDNMQHSVLKYIYKLSNFANQGSHS